MRKRILYVIDTLEVGGTERSLLQLCQHLDRSRFEPIVVSLYEGETLQSEFELADVEVHTVKLRKKYQFFKAWRAICHLIKKYQPDVVHTMLFRASQSGRLAGKWTSCPVISSFVNVPYDSVRFQTEPDLSRWKTTVVQKLDAFTSRYVSRFHAVSKEVKNSNCKALNISKDQVFVIRRGRTIANDRKWNKKEKMIYKDWEFAEGRRLIVNVGRLIPQKGQHDLVDAMPEVVKQFPDALLLIAGEGSLRETLQRQIDTNNLQEYIRLLGYVQDVQPLLALADCFAFPSLYEGLPGSVIEAMLAGCAIVCSDIPMNQELITQGETGILVESGNSQELAAGIISILKEKKLAETYANQARKNAVEKFDICKITRQMEQMYEEVISQSGKVSR